VQIFVELGSHAMLDRSTNGIRGESRSHAFAEARDAASVLLWAVANRTEGRSRANASDGSLADGRFLPMFPIRMVLSVRRCSCCAEKPGKEHRNQENAADPHNANNCARNVPRGMCRAMSVSFGRLAACLLS